MPSNFVLSFNKTFTSFPIFLSYCAITRNGLSNPAEETWISKSSSSRSRLCSTFRETDIQSVMATPPTCLSISTWITLVLEIDKSTTNKPFANSAMRSSINFITNFLLIICYKKRGLSSPHYVLIFTKSDANIGYFFLFPTFLENYVFLTPLFSELYEKIKQC